MFDNFKLPRLIGWIAFVLATQYFIARILFLVWWFIYPESNSRLEPGVGLLDMGFAILWFFAGAGLRKNGEFKNLFNYLVREIRENREITKQGFQKLGEKIDSQSIEAKAFEAQQYKQRMIKQLTSQVLGEARAAISTLDSHGWLTDGSLEGIDLSNANWQGAKLIAKTATGGDTGANLKGVKLKQAKLQGVDMREIDLSNANLHMAYLTGAMLSSADLSFADLTLTDLRGTNLYKSKLTGANFAGATCDNDTRLPNGNRWSHDVDWNKFDAIEEDPLQERVVKVHRFSRGEIMYFSTDDDGRASDIAGERAGIAYPDYIVDEDEYGDRIIFRVIWIKYDTGDYWSAKVRRAKSDELPD